MSEQIFACEVCGQVYDQTCPTCPDRGGGRGFTVAQIKDALRACPTVGDVNDTVRRFQAAVLAMEKAGGAARTMAIQIKNLAGHRRRAIGETWR